MLTVLIEACDNPQELARTLASLVGGAVEGLVREVIIVVSKEAPADVLAVAEHAGCTVVPDRVEEAVQRSRGDWLLLLEAGARLREGWTEAVRAHVEAADQPARFSPARPKRIWSRLFRSYRTLELGILVRKQLAISRATGGQTLAEMANGLRSTRLPAELTPARSKK